MMPQTNEKRLAEIYEIQRELDQKIKENHHLQHKDLIPSKGLALLVEVGELANETRCFKFWSLKPSSADETILEEYVDGLHFILSLGLDQGIEQAAIEQLAQQEALWQSRTGKKEHQEQLVERFTHVFQTISHFIQTRETNDYVRLFAEYLALGSALGFDWEAIYHAYLRKNEINHQRQEEGY